VKTGRGTIILAGDIFLDGNDKENPILKFAPDAVKLTESRRRIACLADWIVPGHDNHTCNAKFVYGQNRCALPPQFFGLKIIARGSMGLGRWVTLKKRLKQTRNRFF
jgi:glyoxylase-like metal-dependent hydrolase (beta-lactamase superfamily II)